MLEYKKLPFINGVDYSLYVVSTQISKGTQAREGTHIHDAYEIYVNLSGNVSFLVNNKIYSISRGSVIVTKPGDVHVCIHNSNCTHEHFCLWLKKTGSNGLTDILDGDDILPNYESKDKEGIVNLVSLLFKAQKEGNELGITSKVFELLEKLSERRREENVKVLPLAVQNAIDYIEKNYSEIKSIKEVSSAVFVSIATLNRIFKQHLSLTPKEFLLAKRLSEAKKLLDLGAQVTDVAMQTGFSDTSYFIEVFKQKFYLTPYKYKREKLNTDK